MTTLALVKPLDQECGCKSQENLAEYDTVEFYGQMFKEALERATQALTEACMYANMINFRVNVEPTNENSKERKELKQQRKNLEEENGWTPNLINSYAKLAEYFPGDADNLHSLDINTIKSLCHEKYQPILERLKQERLTVVEVREDMKAINKELEQEKEPKPMLEWKRTREGKRSLTINDLDEDTGEQLIAKQKESGIEAIALFLRALLKNYSPTEFVKPTTENWRRGWKAGDAVVPNNEGSQEFIEWFERKPAHIIEASNNIGQVQFLKLKRHDGGICNLAYGNWVEKLE